MLVTHNLSCIYCSREEKEGVQDASQSYCACRRCRFPSLLPRGVIRALCLLRDQRGYISHQRLIERPREGERDGWTESESTQGEREGEILNTVQSRDGFRFLFSFFPRFTRPTTGATPMSLAVDGENGRKVGISGPALSVAGEQKDLVQITLRYEGKECNASIESVGLGINSQQTAANLK